MDLKLCKISEQTASMSVPNLFFGSYILYSPTDNSLALTCSHFTFVVLQKHVLKNMRSQSTGKASNMRKVW